MDDCITQHYVFLAQRKHILTEFLNNLKEFHKFSIPFVGYSLSMDDNIFSVIGIELTDLLFLLTDREHWEWLFVFAEMIRLWFSGLTFLVYMNYTKKGSEKDERSMIFSSLVYAFCGFGIVFSYKQPFFVSLLYHLPLLLLGIEKMIREDDRSLFILMTAVSAVCSLYLHYYATVVCIFYCIVRVFFAGNKKRDRLRTAGSAVISYLIGFGISMFLNLHVIITLLESGKISKGIRNLSLTYGWQFFRNLVEGFFQIRVYSIHDTWTGMTPLFLPVLLLLFLRKGRKIQKISLAAVFALMNIPIMSTAAGLSTSNNRWSYCLAFVCAYITCGILPEMINEKDLKTEKRICILSIVFGVYLIFRNAGRKESVLSAVCIILAAASWGLIWALKSTERKYFILFSSLFITLFLNMLESGDIRKLIDIGNTNAYLDSFINSQAREISDSGFFRIDHSNNAKYTTEWNCNLPYWYGYNGVSGFRNILNENFVQYLQQNGFIGLLHRSKIAGFDGRTTDEILSCVKYYLKDPLNPVIPYGFQPTENAVIWKNDLLLPFGYTYSSAVSSDDYRNLNVAERQEILLKSVVLDRELPHFADKLLSRKLETEMTGMMQVSAENGGFTVKKSGGMIQMSVISPLNAEIYLALENTRFSGGKNGSVSVEVDGSEKRAPIQAVDALYTTGQDDYVYNLGRLSEGPHTIVLRFHGTGMVFDDISCYARDLGTVTEDVEKLAAESMTNVAFSSNQITGTIDLSSEKWLTFPLVYSKGWTARVDGEKSELQKANMMYTALRLGPGQHQIELNYFPRGMKTGTVISAFCIMLFLFSNPLKRRSLRVFSR